MRVLSSLTLLTLCACQAPTLEDGDSQFRRGNYRQAQEIYGNLAERAPSAELEARLARVQYFVAEQGIRDLLALNYGETALEALDSLEEWAPADRREVLQGLRQRTHRLIGRLYYERGYKFDEANEDELAAEAYARCLIWDPEHAEARVALKETEDWVATRRRIGEDYYFEGMDHLRADDGLRARTSFMHSASLLGTDSRAAERLENLTDALAEDRRRECRLLIEAGFTGQAWAAAADALMLAPKDERNLELASFLHDRVLGDGYLMTADVAQRGGQLEAAELYLEKARKLAMVEHHDGIESLTLKVQDRRNQVRYARARAYELDHQMVRARELYLEILDDEGGFGWLDVEERERAISARLAEAEAAWAAAQAALAEGDEEEYRRRLEEVLRLAVDFPGAMEAHESGPH